jgi:hypothetical protein
VKERAAYVALLDGISAELADGLLDDVELPAPYAALAK